MNNDHVHPTFQRLIDEHLGLGGPKPKLPASWLASELREIAEQRAEYSATDAFVLKEAANMIDTALRLIGEYRAGLDSILAEVKTEPAAGEP